MGFSVIQELVDEVVTVEDAEIVETMKLMFSDLKLAVEPAGASAVAALLGPLKDRLVCKRVALVICGTNIDMETHAKLVGRKYWAKLENTQSKTGCIWLIGRFDAKHSRRGKRNVAQNALMA